MEPEVQKYQRYKNDIKFLFFGYGLWPGSREIPHIFDMFLSFFAIVVNGLTVAGVIGFCIVNSNNITRLVKGVGMTLSFSNSLIKVFAMIVQRRNMVMLNRSISHRFEQDLKKSEYRPHLLAHFSTISGFLYSFNYIVGLYSLVTVITPLLALRHGKYERMYPQFIPFSYEPGGIIHWIIYTIEILSVMCLWRVNCGTDNMFGLYVLQIVGELRLLSHRFQNFSSRKNYKKELKECIDRHILLLDSHYALQRIFGVLSIWLLISSAIIICTVVFQAAAEAKAMTTVRAIYLVCYCILKLLQAFAYAWYGNIITVESEKCIDSIYKSEWPGSGDLRIMNDILIIQSQNPFIFRAEGCLSVRLDMFSKIVQTAVSYFFLLRTLDQVSQN